MLQGSRTVLSVPKGSLKEVSEGQWQTTVAAWLCNAPRSAVLEPENVPVERKPLKSFRATRSSYNRDGDSFLTGVDASLTLPEALLAGPLRTAGGQSSQE